MAINDISTDELELFRCICKVHNALDKYQSVSSNSANYPGKGTALGLIYLALKLNGEAGELAEHVGKSMRDDGLLPVHYSEHVGTFEHVGTLATIEILPGKGLTDDRRRLLVKECGDVLWYIAAIARELGFTLSEVATINIEKLLDRSERDKLQGHGDER